MLKKIQHKELRIKNFSLASRFLAFSSLSSCIAGKRDNLPLSLDALKSKAGVSLKKKKNTIPSSISTSCPQIQPIWLKFFMGADLFSLFICLFWKVAGEIVGGDWMLHARDR